jgi:hypothetical protein
MRKISLWAKNHKISARFGIVSIYILLNGLGILIGVLLRELEFTFSVTALVSFVCLFLAGLFVYPSKDQKVKLSRRAFYVKQKSCDFILVSSSFLMVVFLANRPEKLFINSATMRAAVSSVLSRPIGKDSVVKPYKTLNEFSASMKDQDGKTLKWKERKKLLKEQVREIRRSNDLSDGAKALLIILSILAALGLLYLVAALSCNLSCSGADAAAIIVGIGGAALVIFLFIIAMRAITGKKKKQKTNTVQTGNES